MPNAYSQRFIDSFTLWDKIIVYSANSAGVFTLYKNIRSESRLRSLEIMFTFYAEIGEMSLWYELSPKWNLISNYMSSNWDMSAMFGIFIIIS